MLEEFWFNIKYGTNHVLDINGYDHILFLVTLVAPYLFKHWKQVFFLVSSFTIGHTISLVLASYQLINIEGSLVEFFILLSIIIIALFNIYRPTKPKTLKPFSFIFYITLFFGVIHGFGFAREFNMFVSETDHRLLTLIEFALGIEIAQLVIVFVALFLGYMAQVVFNCSKRDWVIVVSSIVVGLSIPLILNCEFLL